MAKEQARLHEKFDELVASSALDHYICKVSSSMVGTIAICLYVSANILPLPH
jgi:hypothetical protein